MAERRRHKRVKKRVQVNYGERDLEQRGMATDISISGMFLDCRRPPDIGTRLSLQVMDADRPFYVEAEVVRIRRVDPRLRTLEKEGAGLRFLSPAELIAAAVPRDERVQLTNTLVCKDALAVKSVLSEQIYSRIIVVPVSEPPPPAGEVVEFTIHIEIGDGIDVEGQGRVLQLIGGDGASLQAVLQLDDANAIKTALEELLG